MKKHILISALALAAATTAFAQPKAQQAQQPKCEIALDIAGITEGEDVPPAINSKLEAKLKTILTQCGVAGGASDQFFIAARFDHGYYDVLTAGPDTKYVMNTDLQIFIGDYVNQKKFAEVTIPLKGAGNSKERAYQMCLNQLNPRNQQFRDFVEEGKAKIVDYFNKMYPSILQKARTAMESRNYDEALFYSTSIPECCDGYDQAQALSLQIYDHHVNYEADQLLAQARAEWAADPTAAGARKAMNLISRIDPAANCQAEAYALSNKIAKTVNEQWYFENVKKYEDRLAMEKQRMQTNAALEKQRIKAARDVAVAWASNQPKVVHHYHWLY